MQFLDSIPPELVNSVERWWERAAASRIFLDAYAALAECFRKELPRVLAGSEFAAAALVQDPAALEWFAHCEAAGESHADYERRAASAATTLEAQRILREWRRREMLRIAWRDI